MQKILATAIGYLMKLIYSLVNNYGLSIILLTFIVRALLLPLYNKQNKYSAAMQELQPKINEIQTRYAADRQTMNEKLNEVYANADVNPMSGCLPMLIQFPIIIGLFALLRSPLLYINGENMIAAVHEAFLWIPDLCQPDAWILPVAAGITTYFSSAGASAADTTGSTKIMTYFLPIMIFILGMSFPAGLALYWTAGNIFTMIQTFYFNAKRKKASREKEINDEVKKRLKKK